jgi:hypothetical protein
MQTCACLVGNKFCLCRPVRSYVGTALIIQACASLVGNRFCLFRPVHTYLGTGFAYAGVCIVSWGTGFAYASVCIVSWGQVLLCRPLHV